MLAFSVHLVVRGAGIELTQNYKTQIPTLVLPTSTCNTLAEYVTNVPTQQIQAYPLSTILKLGDVSVVLHQAGVT